MKKKIYDYICKHDHVCVPEISKALNSDGLKVLRIVNELSRDGYIEMSAIVPLGPNNDNSCYYSATGKKYVEE